MSDFSEKCKELLEENGTNVYRLSNQTSLERTALQRMVTGKRLPNINFVKSFCQELRLPHSEENHLLELYKIEQIGKSTFYNRKNILSLLAYLADSKSEDLSNPYRAYSLDGFTAVDSFTPIPSTSYYDTEMMIYSILTREFQSDEPTWLYTNLPASDKNFFYALSLLYYRFKKDVPVTHLVHFQMNAKKASYNLETLQYILPFALTDSMNYTAYYFYSKLTDRDFSSLLFPYYMITPHYVLMFSEDLTCSVCHTEPEMIDLCTKSFQDICQHAAPLITEYPSELEIWNVYSETLSPPQKILEPMPCIQDMLTPEMFTGAASVLPPRMAPIVKKLIHYWAKNSASAESQTICYTRCGIEAFAKNGHFYGQIASYLPPLTIPQRITALEQYLKYPAKSKYYMLKDKFKTAENLNFELYPDKRFLQVIKIDGISNVSLLRIEESSIYEAFADFYDALTEPGFEYVYSHEEETAIIQGLINSLKKQTSISK